VVSAIVFTLYKRTQNPLLHEIVAPAEDSVLRCHEARRRPRRDTSQRVGHSPCVKCSGCIIAYPSDARAVGLGASAVFSMCPHLIDDVPARVLD